MRAGLTNGDLVLLGELLDGKLDAVKRRAAIARLDTDERFYEVFVESLRYLSDSRPITSHERPPPDRAD